MLKFSFEWKKANCSLYETFSPDVECVRCARDFYFSDDLYQIASPDDGYGDFTAVYGRDGKKLHGFAYRNPVMVDYRHKRDSVYKIYKKVWKNGWVSPYLLEDVHLPTHPND